MDVLEDVGLSEQNWVLWPHAPGLLPELPELPFCQFLIKVSNSRCSFVFFLGGGGWVHHLNWKYFAKDDYLFSYQSWKSLVRGMVMNGHPSMNMYL